jgi:hypothetical protein
MASLIGASQFDWYVALQFAILMFICAPDVSVKFDL